MPKLVLDEPTPKLVEDKPRLVEDNSPIQNIIQHPVKSLLRPISETLGGKSPKDVITSKVQENIDKEANKGNASWMKNFLTYYVAGNIGDVADIATTPATYIPIPAGRIIGKIPMGGTTLGKIAKEIPVGKGFVQGAKELGMKEQTLKNLPNLIKPVNVTPEQKVVQAIKEAKPIRGRQESIYSEERAKRAKALSDIGKTESGEQAYIKQLGSLKGEMEKVQFESLRGKVQQQDIDSLFNQVENTSLSPFEKITTKNGLAKILGANGGTVPTKGELDLLGQVFSPEFIKTTLEKQPLMQKLWGGFEQALNLPRAMMATADLSAPLRQGVFLVGRPKEWGPAFRDMFKYAFSEKAYKGFYEDLLARPTYQIMKDSGLSLTDTEAVNLAGREEMFMSNLAEKIPVFGKFARGSNRAYTGFLNKLRADTFDNLYKTMESQGVLKERPEAVKDLSRFINFATGRGDLGRLQTSAALLNGTFFSPRLMASRIGLLRPDFYVKLDPFVRKEALKSLATFLTATETILSLAMLNGAEVGTDPRSADFMKMKFGKTRFDPWGGFQQYLVLASRLFTNQMVSSTTGREFTLGEGYKPTNRLDIIQRFFESKTAPVASFALSLLKGQTSMGDKVSIPAETIELFVPMLTQDVVDLYKEKGMKGIPMAIPGLFGVGSQTYEDQIPMMGRTSTGAKNIQWQQQPGIGQMIVNKMTGKELSNIPKELWKPIADERMKELLRQVEIDRAKKTVLLTGKEMRIGDTRIYLDRGVVKTERPKTWSLKKEVLSKNQ